jgi:hypothetical protein
VKDDTRPFALCLDDQRFVKFSDHKDNAGDLHLNESLDIFDRSIGFIVCIQQKEVITTSDDGSFDALYYFREKRIRDVGNKQSNNLASPPTLAFEHEH